MNGDQTDRFSRQLETSTSGFRAKLTSPKVLAQILKVLNFREDVTVHLLPNGLKITAEISKSFQASAFIPQETFLEYSVSEGAQEDDEEISFNISLPTLISCLNMCGAGLPSNTNATAAATHLPLFNMSSTSMLLYYPELGQPLRILLEDDGVVSGK